MKNKWLVLFAVLSILVLIVSCAPKPTVAPVKTDAPVADSTLRDLQKGKPFIYVGNNFAHPTIKVMMLGFWDACKKYDVDCKFIVDTSTEDSGLIAAQEKAIAFGASGLVTASYLQFRAVTVEAQKAGIPAVGFHGNLSAEDDATDKVSGLVAWVAPEPLLYGAAVADAMKEKIGCEGPVIVTQSMFNITEDAANKGFVDEWAKVCPGSVVLPVEQEGLEPVAAIAKVSAVLMAHPDLKGAFGTTGGSINAWGKALQQLQYKAGDVCLIGMDATKENIDMIKSGYAYMLVNQPVYAETYKAVEILIANMTGKPFAYDNPLSADLVGIDGLDALSELAARSLTDLPK